MKFKGVIGFTTAITESIPGVWSPASIVEHTVVGDVVKNYTKPTVGSNANTDIDINNEFSVLMPQMLRQQIFSIKYVKWNGVKWRVTSADLASYPRAIIQVGGIYNENQIAIS